MCFVFSSRRDPPEVSLLVSALVRLWNRSAVPIQFTVVNFNFRRTQVCSVLW